MLRSLLICFSTFNFITQPLLAQDSVLVLQEVPVFANRIQTGFNELSANIIVIKADEIKSNPALSVTDLLHYFGGVDIRQRGAHGVQADAGIRGSTFDQVLILINGIKISDAQTGHHSLNLPVDIENVERIEILKGAAARIFGQNAFAGAINIITKNPEGTFMKVRAIAGEHGLGGWGLSASMQDSKVAHYLSASRDFSDGYQYNTDYLISNYFYQSSWNSKVGKFNLLAGLTDRGFGANGFYASPAFQDQYESIQTSLTALTLQTQPNENLSVSHRLYWRRNQDEYLFIRNNPPAYRNLHTNNTIGYEVNAVFNNKLGSTGIGLDINQLNLKSNNLGDRERTVATLFLEHRLEMMNKKMDITPGAQLNYYSDFGTNLFPGVDVGYVLTKKIKAYANLGYTYRVPTYTDLYYSDPANVGNPDLKPEYAISYEVGLKFLNINWFSGQASYFVRNGKRIIDWTKEATTDPWRPDNLIGINMSGWDVNFSFLPALLLHNKLVQRLAVSYTFIDAEKVEGQSLSRYAFENLNHQVVISLGLQYAKRLQHTVNFRYSDRVNLPDYSVTDTRLSWNGKSLTYFADVTNIFDKPYKETNLVTLPGRWMKAGITYTFKKD
jgi:vitamin B12 transporter